MVTEANVIQDRGPFLLPLTRSNVSGSSQRNTRQTTILFLATVLMLGRVGLGRALRRVTYKIPRVAHVRKERNRKKGEKNGKVRPTFSRMSRYCSTVEETRCVRNFAICDDTRARRHTSVSLTGNLLNFVMNYLSPTGSDTTSHVCFSLSTVNLMVYPRCIVSARAILKYTIEFISILMRFFSCHVKSKNLACEKKE